MIIEQAFCLVDNKKYTATEYKEFINNKRRNRKAYSDFLVCPYCKIARCEYVYNRRHPYFEMPDDAKHSADCLYMLTEYTQAEIKTQIKMKNLSFFERHIARFCDSYFGKTTDSSIKEFKRLPQRLITQSLKASDTSIYSLFYGNAKIITEDTENGKLLKISSDNDNSNNDNNVYCEITITERAFKFLDAETKSKILSPDKSNFICFFGSFDQFGLSRTRDKEENCYVSPLLYSSFLKII